MSHEYERAMGARLHALRKQRNLSLRGVEKLSGGGYKAAVIGSYERGTRAVPVSKLPGLARFYGVSVASLLPSDRVGDTDPGYLVLDLRPLARLPAAVSGPLARYAAAVRSQPGPHAATLTIRSGSLRTLAVLYRQTPEELAQHLLDWGVLARRAAQ